MSENSLLINRCRSLLDAYASGSLWYIKMPEDEHPEFLSQEERLVYFTLPMSLNYQRNSYTLRESALKSYNDPEVTWVYDIWMSATYTEDILREKLLRHKLALQPNKHISTRSRISKTIHEHRWTLSRLLEYVEYDFLNLQEICQKKHKKWFPYLSWPKIFHYRCYVLWEYCNVSLKNAHCIQIAPDTHVMKASVRLWVLSEKEAEKLTRDEISQRRRQLLEWSKILPMHMHSPLWFWSRNSFQYQID